MALPPEDLEALLAMPAMEAPDDVTANFENPPNQNGLAWFVQVFCIIITLLAVILRLYARMWTIKRVHKEEGRYRLLRYKKFATMFDFGVSDEVSCFPQSLCCLLSDLLAAQPTLASK